MIKKSVLAVLLLLLLVATTVWAAKVNDISATKHNMSMYAALVQPQYYAATEEEVCIFCHTPHGGTLNTPLWNRTLPDQSGASAFTHYTSATLSPYMGNTAPAWINRPVNDESLLCMSCHDGLVAMNAITNISNRTGVAPDGGTTVPLMSFQPWGPVGVGMIIGDAPDETNTAQGLSRDLTDDHPISFSYIDAYNSGTNSTKLRLFSLAEDDGIRFFGPNASGGKRVECSSCHDPHVNGNVDTNFLPFLTVSNAASNLCLACHIK